MVRLGSKGRRKPKLGSRLVRLGDLLSIGDSIKKGREGKRVIRTEWV